MGYIQRKLPAAPLQRFLCSFDRDHPWQPLVTRVEIARGTPLYRAYLRAIEDGEVSWIMADKIACALGTHPGVLWPEWWDLEDAS